MTEKSEALRLAEMWEKQSHGYALTPEAKTAAELRRLHAVNAELLEALKRLLTDEDYSQAERVARAAIARAEGDARAKEQRDGVKGPVVRCGGQQLARRKA